MNLLRLWRPTVFCISMFFLLPARAFTQVSGTDIFLAANIPGLFYFKDISKYAKNSIGFSLTSRLYLAKKISLTTSIRYDNFNYKPLDKRVGDYAQLKMGITYFDNLAGRKLNKLLHDTTIISYSVVDCGLGIKLNPEMIGNKTCIAYSIGYGVKKICKNRMILDLCYDWVNLKLGNGITASWLDYRIGLGYQLGK